MKNVNMFNNSIITRRTKIKYHLNNFFPNVIANLISEYDYQLEGNSITIREKGYVCTDCISISVLSDDGKNARIVNIFGDTIQLQNLQTGDSDDIFIGPNKPVCSIDVLYDDETNFKIVCGMTCWNNGSNIVEIWNAQTKKLLHTFLAHDGRINCIAVLPNKKCLSQDVQEKLIVTGSTDTTLKIWNIMNTADINKPDTNCVLTFTEHTAQVTCVAVLPDNRIVSGSYDSILKIWNPLTGRCDCTFKGNTANISCVAVLPDNETKFKIVSGDYNGILHIWNPEPKQSKLILKGHNSPISCVAILPDNRIISGSHDKTFKIWNPQTGNCDNTFEGYSAIKGIWVLNDGRIVIEFFNGKLEIWS